MQFSRLGTATLMLVPFIFCEAVTGQNIMWDSSYRPNLYETRVGQFRSFRNSRNDIIFLGNSIVAYANWNELLNNQNVINRGIPGDISFGVIERLDEITEGHPAGVFILIGINDIARNIPDSVIIRNYRRIIRSIKGSSPDTQIYFHTLLPVNNTFHPPLPHFDKDEHILRINEELKALGKKEGVTIIDLFAAFRDHDLKLDKQYSFDGLHLNDKGYLKWAAILKAGRFIKN